jgi:hypothetical protein
MPSETERFQSFCRRFINRKVRENFKDLGGEDFQADFRNERHFSRHICTHQDDDPLTLTIGRLMVYYFEVRGLIEEPIYSIPSSHLHESVQGVPQLILTFKESRQDSIENKRYKNPLEAQHYIRVKTDFSSESEVMQIARRVRDIFVTPRYHLDKGRIKFTYYNKSKGHEFKILAESESEAKNLITKILATAQEEPDWDYLSDSRKTNRDFNKTQYIRFNGKRYKKPTRRPSGRVHFVSAELHVDGVPYNLYLIDLEGRSKNVILKV